MLQLWEQSAADASTFGVLTHYQVAQHLVHDITGQLQHACQIFHSVCYTVLHVFCNGQQVLLDMFAA